MVPRAKGSLMSGIVDGCGRGLGELGKSLADTLLPRSCQGCGEVLEINDRGLCVLCWHGLREAIGDGEYCPRCGAAVGAFTQAKGGCNKCRDLKPRYERLVRVGRYRGPLAGMIRKLKFSRGTDSARLLGELLFGAVQAVQWPIQFELVSWVPLHWRRRWGRGYDQAELLARKLGDLSGQGTFGLLRRTRLTAPQTHLSRQRRRENVRGAFAVRRGVDVADKKILLVDDVLTTGATANEAAGVLRKAGAEVSVAVVAVAG